MRNRLGGGHVPVPRVPAERIAKSFGVGGFEDSTGRGVLLKWIFPDGRHESFVMGADHALLLLRDLERTIQEGRFVKPTSSAVSDDPLHPVNVFLAMQPNLTQADFDGGAGSRTVAGWHWHVMSDGVILSIEFANEDRSVLAFDGQLCFYLREYLVDITRPRTN